MPMLFLHGQNDHFINYTNANELFQEKIRYEIPKKVHYTLSLMLTTVKFF